MDEVTRNCASDTPPAGTRLSVQSEDTGPLCHNTLHGTSTGTRFTEDLLIREGGLLGRFVLEGKGRGGERLEKDFRSWADVWQNDDTNNKNIIKVADVSHREWTVKRPLVLVVKLPLISAMMTLKRAT